MDLARYRQKRDFSQTPEPRGVKKKTAKQLSFVIQKHAARRLHYDFRLELEGVLLSWAVPKGPSLDPAEKRLAVHVEDHPIEYGGFEGIIPPKQYGAGTVLLWDRGVWRPDSADPVKDYRSGKLKFHLEGEKLSGGWTLVRMGGRANADAAPGKENWLLIKERDEAAKPGSDTEVVDTLPASVASGRKIEEIASDPGRVWHSNKAAAMNAAPETDAPKPAASKKATPKKARAASKTKASLPELLTPELATRVDKPPAGDGWLHEIKLDGYRMLCRLENGKTQLFTRNSNDWSDRFPSLIKAASALPVQSAWIDGEIVVIRGDGTTSFQELQNILTRGSEAGLIYYAFDLLFVDGRDVRDLPLTDRKALLAAVFEGAKGSRAIRYGDHVEGGGAMFLEQACEHALEGIISKRADSPYRSGRGRDWIKVKCGRRQEFVVGGYTDPAGSRSGFGALLIGFYENGELRYAGRVGTGFDEQSLRELHKKLAPLAQKKSPFVNPPTGYEARGVHWTAPELVAEIAFGAWTDDGIIRHASFQGVREDKAAADVTRETAVKVTATPTRSSKIARAKPVAQARSVKHGEALVAGVRLTHPDRVLFPERSLTKLAIAQYYEAIAPGILPHLEGRPLTLVRCPDGNLGKCFYQKNANETVPDEIDRVLIPGDDGTSTYMMVNSIEALVAVVQMGALELHTWGSKNDRLDRPDRITFDLDPDAGLGWNDVVDAAKILRARLQDLKLESFLKTTGGKGLHIVVPIARRNDWDEVKAFSKAIAEELVQIFPAKFTSNPLKVQRKGKLFIDYLRNGEGATAIAAYSTRAREGAPISAPLRWNELGKFRSDEFNVLNIAARLAKLRADPWQGYDDVEQALTKTMWKKLGQ